MNISSLIYKAASAFSETPANIKRVPGATPYITQGYYVITEAVSGPPE